MANFLRSLALLLFLSAPTALLATHYQGGELLYECLGGNQYRVTLRLYRDCAGVDFGSSIQVNFASTSCGQNFNQSLPLTGSSEVSQLCASDLANSTCNGGALPGTEQYIYQGIVTLPAVCPDWLASVTLSNRNNAITNLVAPGNNQLYIEAEIDNSGSLCNNSPSFTSLPVPYICNGEVFNFNHGAVDADGDSLVYTLIQPRTGGGTPIGYNPGFTPGYPIVTASSTFPFNTETGAFSFTPAGVQISAVAVRVDEYRGGVKVGSVMRDIQMVVLSCSNGSPTNVGGISNIVGTGVSTDSLSIELCPGELVNFDLIASDPDGADILTMTSNLAASIPGATFNTAGTNPVTGSFSWTPTGADVGLRSFTVTVADDACPSPGQQIFTVNIRVLQGTSAGPDLTYCITGGGAQLQATGGSSFTWTPATGLSCTSCPNPIATPASAQQYIVTSNLSGTCKNQDTLVVTPIAGTKPTTSAISGDTPLCPNSTGTYSVSLTAGSSYQWILNAPSPAAIASAQGSNTIDVSWAEDDGTISVVETNATGCFGDTIEFPVVIQGPPTGPISGADYHCKNGLADGNFTNYSTTGPPSVSFPWNNPPPLGGGASFYEWEISFGGAAFNDASAVTRGEKTQGVTFNNYQGPVILRVREVDDAGCVHEWSNLEIDVAVRPGAPTLTGPNQVCSDDTVTFNVTSGGDDFIWDFGIPGSGIEILSGDSSNAVTVKWGSSNYCVRVTAGVPVCPSFSQGQICNVSINEVVLGALRLNPSTLPACGTNFQVFQDVCTNCQSGTYQWIVPTGMQQVSGGGSSSSNVTVRQVLPDCYGGELCFSAASAAGCRDTVCTTIPGIALPVEWVGFSVGPGSAPGTALVEWHTGLEENNSHFLIERSLDGANFEVVGQVPSAGVGANSYAWTDAQAPDGLAYYRIRQVDWDGASGTSPMRIWQQGTGETVSLFLVDGGQNLQLTGLGDRPTGYRYQVFDVQGRLIHSGQISENAQVSTRDLPSQRYLLSIQSGNVRVVRSWWQP